jgi:hypothetical protein
LLLTADLDEDFRPVQFIKHSQGRQQLGSSYRKRWLS